MSRRYSKKYIQAEKKRIRRIRRLKRAISVKLGSIRPLPVKGSYKNALYAKYGNYNTYINSKEWSYIKELYYSISELKRCESCGSKSALEVHHRSYGRLGSPSEIYDLHTLCRKCHQSIHEIEKTKAISLKWATDDIIPPSRLSKRGKNYQKRRYE